MSSTNLPDPFAFWVETADGPRLLGSRCEECGLLAFPVARGCLACGATALVTIELSPFGRVESRSQIGVRIVGEVRLEKGPLLLAELDSRDELPVGSTVVFSPGEQPIRFASYVR
jgi:uncharacterized OB-fold protein